jgi:peroxiredoxin
VKKLADRPFALVGVNVSAYSAQQLKEIMDKEDLNWRSTADQGGAIAEAWNSPGTPVYYALDAAGMIRYKWVGNPGEKAIDAALEKLIEEVEGRRERN